MSETKRPTFFATPADFRRWLDKNHRKAAELLVGFFKRATGRPSITWPESVDEALCFGWIDGVRRSIDASSYSIRFTPRRRGSTWSEVNVRRVAELSKRGLMRPAGLAAFAVRDEKKTALSSYERRSSARLAPDEERRFRADAKAWAYFQARPPWYRSTAVCWIVSAKKPETRVRRLKALIEDSRAGRPIGPLAR